MLLQNYEITWNVLQMVTVTTKKVITKCVHHNMLLKTLLRCAHIPLNAVPKGAQPLAQLESLGRSRDSLVKKTRGWG